MDNLKAVDYSYKINSKKLNRDELLLYFENTPKDTLVAMEACSGSNYWGQEFKKLGLDVKLLKTIDVKAYAKSKQKNDTNDALAIAKAARDPELKQVEIRQKETQEIAFLHKTRQNIIQKRIMISNSLIGSLHEFGYDAVVSKAQFAKVASEKIQDAHEKGHISLNILEIMQKDIDDINELFMREKDIETKIKEQNKVNKKAKRLQTIPGIGPINASFLQTLPIETYKSPRDFAASLGLVPNQYTTGGHIQLGSISKKGSKYGRTMLIQGARSLVIRARCLMKQEKESDCKLIKWGTKLLSSGKSFNKTCIALANKLARIIYCIIVRNETYNP